MRIRTVTVFLPVILLFTGCFLHEPNRNLNVIIEHKKKDFRKASLLIFNFKEPVHAEGKGQIVSALFHKHLLKEKKFKVASVYNNSPWHRLGETEELRLRNAVKEGAAKQYEYILVGDITTWFYGGLNKTRVGLKIRLIDVKKGVTVFMAENSRDKKAKDPSYPLDTKLGKTSVRPEALADYVTWELVKKM